MTKAVSLPASTIHRYVEKLRATGASDAEVIRQLERQYLRTITATGAAAGGVAAFPGIGTLGAAALIGSDVATFLAASAFFTLAVADTHGVPIDDVERRKTLVVTTLLGPEGAALIADTANVGIAQVGRTIMTALPRSKVAALRGTLTRRLAARQLAKASTGLVGRLVPFGIGAAIGAAASRGLGRAVISGARAAFGSPSSPFAPVAG